MTKIIILIIFVCSLSAFGQTSNEHLQNGIAKHNQNDFKGAIEEYSKAIKADETNEIAYFNRGTCELALKNFDAALSDFDKTIEKNPKFVKAYYSRATVFVSQEKYKEALPDLDKTVELEASYPNALTLRGQIRAQNGNVTAACEDFKKAKENGDPQADKYLTRFCGNSQLEGESLMLDWPDSENWKMGDNQENDNLVVLDLIHSNETLENWTELGNMMSIKGVKNVQVDNAMNLMYEEAKKKSDNAKLTFIEKDESAEHPWIIFTIEAPNFKNDDRPESQLWFIIQGKQALYTNFRAIKQAAIPNETKDKWIKFFKTARIVYK